MGGNTNLLVIQHASTLSTFSAACVVVLGSCLNFSQFQESHSNSISGNGSRGSLGGSSSSSSNNLRAATPSVNRPLLAPEEAAPLLPAEVRETI